MELLATCCRVQGQATEVDISVVLRFVEAGQLKSAYVLIDAGADLPADRIGQNALHKIRWNTSRPFNVDDFDGFLFHPSFCGRRG